MLARAEKYVNQKKHGHGMESLFPASSRRREKRSTAKLKVTRRISNRTTREGIDLIIPLIEDVDFSKPLILISTLESSI